MLRIIAGDLEDERLVELLRAHVAAARAHTEPGSSHALDLEGLKSPDIRLWSIWDDATLVGVGALQRLSREHGEVKSMHTVESVRRRGVASAMLQHIVDYVTDPNSVFMSLDLTRR